MDTHKPERRNLESSGTSAIAPIHQHYKASMTKVGLTTVAAVVVLMAVQVWVLLSHAETAISQALDQKTSALNALSAEFTSQLTAMRRTAETYYQKQYEGGGDAAPDLAPTGPDHILSLDHLSESQRFTRGNIFYQRTAERDEAEQRRLLAVADLLFDIQAPFHQANAYVTLSYFSARDITSIYPWISLNGLETAMGMSVPKLFFLLDTGAFELWAKALPDVNPTRSAFWTKPYLDVAGNGIMVTHSAPVYAGDRMLGTVSIDITLSSLSELIRLDGMPGGTLLLIDGDENIVAASDMPAKAVSFLNLAERLPKDAATAAMRMLTKGGQRKEMTGASSVYTSAMPGTPWRLIYVLPLSDLFVNVVFLNIAQVLVFSLILAVAFFIMHSFIVRNFLKPSIASFAQMEDLRLYAEKASRAKTSLLANASHDLRQPLQAMDLLIGALDTQEGDAKKRGIIASLRNCVGSFRDLLNTLLDNTKLEAGIIRPEMREFPVDQLIERIASEMGAVAAAKRLRLETASCGAIVHSDPSLVAMIVRNFVDNAIKYTDQGMIRVGCRLTEGGVRFEVEDTGPGISPKERELIFQDFYQIKIGSTATQHGLGLGLAIVRRVAHLLGGAIGCESEPGRGSLFWLDLPAAPDPCYPRA